MFFQRLFCYYADHDSRYILLGREILSQTTSIVFSPPTLTRAVFRCTCSLRRFLLPSTSVQFFMHHLFVYWYLALKAWWGHSELNHFGFGLIWWGFYAMIKSFGNTTEFGGVLKQLAVCFSLLILLFPTAVKVFVNAEIPTCIID